jgi:lipid-A-disaccharide synthase
MQEAMDSVHVFISAGEPSGDLHGSNLIGSLKQLDSTITFSGLGGERMIAAGITPLVHVKDLSVVGLLKVAERFFDLSHYLDLVRRHFMKNRPDVVVLIDFPGFNWWVATRAREFGIPVIYFVPPQLWAWGGWRVAKMKKLIDKVLCNFEFEKQWFHARGVNAELVGHPYFDELINRQIDTDLVHAIKSKGSPVIGILPGSRGQELHQNLGSQLQAATIIHKKFPSAHFHVACLHQRHADLVREKTRSESLAEIPITIHSGTTKEVISASDCTISVSGSVSLELLQAAVPSVILYQASRPMIVLAKWLMKCRFISLPNLIADKELFPEFVNHKPLGTELAGTICDWLINPQKLEQSRQNQKNLWNSISKPGACDRAARQVVHLGTTRMRKAS